MRSKLLRYSRTKSNAPCCPVAKRQSRNCRGMFVSSTIAQFPQRKSSGSYATMLSMRIYRHFSNTVLSTTLTPNTCGLRSTSRTKRALICKCMVSLLFLFSRQGQVLNYETKTGGILQVWQLKAAATTSRTEMPGTQPMSFWLLLRKKMSWKFN